MKAYLAAISGLLILATPVPASAQASAVRVRTVVVDPGHGGKDAGCVSRDGKTYEKTVALDIATRLADKIRAAHPDVKALMTRSDDRYIPLDERAGFANKHDADLFISVHINAQDGGTAAHGYSIHCLGQSSREGNDLFSKNLELCKRENSVILLEDDYQTRYQGFDPSDPQSYILFSLMQNAHLEHSLAFAEDVANAMKGGPISRSRGVSQDPFWVLWRTTMPSVLVEVGFMTNPNDLQTMRSPEGRDKIAANLLKAIQTFKKRYDNSTATTTTPQKADQADVKPAPETGEAPATPAVEAVSETSGTVYGIQVLATSKKMKPADPFFKGYTPTEVVSGKLYKYIIIVGGDLADARRKKRELDQRFPGCFLVSKEGETITRVR